jgi:hypothetical protein
MEPTRGEARGAPPTPIDATMRMRASKELRLAPAAGADQASCVREPSADHRPPVAATLRWRCRFPARCSAGRARTRQIRSTRACLAALRSSGPDAAARLPFVQSNRPALDWPRRPQPGRRRRSPTRTARRADSNPTGPFLTMAVPRQAPATQGGGFRSRAISTASHLPPMRPFGSMSVPTTRPRRLRQGREPFSDPGARRDGLPVAGRLQRGASRGRARLLGRGRGG